MKTIKTVKVTVKQPNDEVYFEKYFPNLFQAMDKFLYFCKVASINYPDEVDYEVINLHDGAIFSAYYPENEENMRNQSKFIDIELEVRS